ncbi:hypothetical protein SUGI_0505930 [Cryptomeria japonica]|uniref:uncharacterized protein LOC131060465 n=1 Tax=Cryptomeria japonica TaxID=3369 RepID=UPI002408DDEE|nr:uncharacterized protein LOC131060465 [Cryptomeria japonica]XP_057849682.1 uncharacterized protein LOC131060465 [Cryptomeria japonica]XP_057849684.1 uncharacterized protein LOC131060465 [Cryptomeria japonica]XP_057849685.1 uncharacterized protein LOC131060465 [Cryptomeria japonica]XP_057849686.1 uncharacterized protein LOC131060465 [Cryptomeria japonica]GLJ26308.1 hypothetical protein SUGI_0505930 [Cryptomeria japonica]
MLDSLFCRGSASKCKSLIKNIKSRVEFLRKKRNGKASLQRRDITELLQKGENQKALSRVDLLFLEENVLYAYNMIESFCDCILKGLSSIQKHKDCPRDIKEAASSLIFAAARCAEIPELQSLRGIFATIYGEEFAIAARELHPDCGVNQQIIENLSGGPPTSDAKLSLMIEIAEKAGLQWEHLNFKDGFERQQSLISSKNTAGLSHMPSSLKTSLDGTMVHAVKNGRILESQYSRNVNRQKASMSAGREDVRQVGCEDVYERDIPVVSSSIEEIGIISNNHEKTPQAENPKPSARSRRNVQKFAADPVHAADCERTSNKKQFKADVVDQSFNTSIERQEVVEDTRHGYSRPSKNKNSRHTYGGQIKDPYECKNGHPDVPFLEENNEIPEKELGLKSATLIKSDGVRKSKPTGRTSNLNVDGETLQEASEEFVNRRFPDNYSITREGSVWPGNGSYQYGENGVHHSRHRGHNRPSKSRESCVENDEVRMFDKPCEGFHGDSIQECKSEYQDLSKTRSSMMSKSNKMFPGSTYHDVKKDSMYNANEIDNCRLPTNGSNYVSVEPSTKKSNGRKVYGEGFLEPQEGPTFKVVVDYPEKWDSTSQYIGGQIDNGVHDKWHGSDGNDEYHNELDSSPSRAFDKHHVHRTYGAGLGPSQAHERLHGRASGTRVYYTNEHDEEKHNIRREADNGGRKSVNRKRYGVAKASQPVDNEEEHETYYSVQETLYETNKGNLNSFGRVPYESQKHGDKGEQQRNYPLRDDGRSHNPAYLSSKNLYESVDNSSDEEHNIWQPNSTREHTKYAYPLDVDSKKRSDVGWQTQEGKPQYGRKGSLDSRIFHGGHGNQHPELQDYHCQKLESLGLYMNETHITDSKSERRHLDNCQWDSGSINDNSTLPEYRRVYADKREKYDSGLKDVHQIDRFENVNRYHTMQSERRQKVPISSDSYIQHSEQTNGHHLFTGSNGISEGKECSPEKGRRQDIQNSKSQRTRSKQRTQEIQYENLESTSVKNFSRPPTARVVKRDSYATPIDRPLPLLPPSSPAPKPSYVNPEDILGKSVNAFNEVPPQRHQEHYRTASMSNKSPARSDSLKAKLVKSQSDVGISGTRHVHPKLPDCDDLTARFAALKQQRQASNSE